MKMINGVRIAETRRGQPKRATDAVDERIDATLNVERLWNALTMPEQRLAMALVAGGGVEAVARRAGIAPKTVQNRAYTIAAKWRAICEGA